jgi:AcrR family transcriptional regulator
MTATWSRQDVPADAAARLLDAAGEVFARRGVVDVTVADVAAAAGCARGTVYRCFPDREALRRAFVARETGRVGARVGARIASIPEPRDRLVEATLAALDEVRADPVLSAWFTEASSSTAARVAAGTETLGQLVGVFLDGLFAEAERQGQLRPGVDREAIADGIVRVVLSLLAQPPDGAAGERAARERRIVEQLLVPAVFT